MTADRLTPPSAPRRPRVALVHDWLTGMRGGEKVLDAICETLPRPTARQLEEARRLAEEGPPAELVGLEPFGAPEPAGVGT